MTRNHAWRASSRAIPVVVALGMLLVGPVPLPSFTFNAAADIGGGSGELFGSSAAGLGDLDSPSDGFHELVIGAPKATTPGGTPVVEAGAVAVFRGSSDIQTRSLTMADADLVIRGASTAGHLGQAIGTTDWNGNGRLDLLVGEPDNGPGRMYVVPDSLITA